MSDAPTAGRPPDPPTCIAFLDASVLYPATLRNLLMHLAVAGVFRPLWTDRVQDEWTAALLRDRPDLDAARLAHRRALMDTYIYDARVTGYEPLIDGLVLPDPDLPPIETAAVSYGRDLRRVSGIDIRV